MLTKLCAKCGRVMSLGSALCAACQTKADERHKQYDNNVRDKRSARFYASAQWIRLRDAMMARAGYQCEVCKRAGRLTWWRDTRRNTAYGGDARRHNKGGEDLRVITKSYPADMEYLTLYPIGDVHYGARECRL